MDKAILLIGAEDFPTCLTCSRRMKTLMVKVSGQWAPASVGSNEEGPIFRSVCEVHGPQDFQVVELNASEEAA